jgi:hypothetical protein
MRVTITRFFLLFAFAVFSTLSLSAQRDCGTMEALEQAIEQDPTILDRMEKLEEFTRNFRQDPGEKAVFSIPVVVHVVYRNGTQNISDAQVQSQIAVMNEDFRRLNSDADGVWSQAADTEIEFCLATVDPNGNATSGITRTTTTESSFSNGTKRVHRNSTGGKDAWPAADYMNMWVCDLAGGGLGYAQFPNTGVAATDGIVIDYAYFGRGGSAQAPFDLGRTATHEVGHYLNLRHIWGDGNCNADDFVTDTPTSDASNGGCQIGSVSCGSVDMVQNYMDYSDDGCMNLFTAGQKTRMTAALSGARASLANSNGCGTPGGGGGACTDTEVALNIVADNYGSETTWTLTGPSGTVASGGPYTNNSTNSETFCLPDGCYDFTINDAYGDGICCTYGNGSYALSGGGVSESGGSFGSTETKNFCIGGNNPPAPTCNDGVQNGNETGVDCGGDCTPCDTGGGGCTDIDFASDNGTWNDGGSDCVRSRTRPIQGTRSVYLRDNTSSSVLTSDAFDLSSLEELTVDFSYYPYSMENGEDFWLQVDNGSDFQTVQTWASGTDFNNNTLYNESVTITATGGFGTSVRVRFRCDASGNSDYVHLDNIVLGGCQTNGARINLGNTRENLTVEAVEADDFAEDVAYKVFPNPARGNFNVQIEEEGYTARLTSVTGQTLMERQLNVGTNRFSTDKLAAGMYLLILEGADGFREVEKVVLRK